MLARFYRKPALGASALARLVQAANGTAAAGGSGAGAGEEGDVIVSVTSEYCFYVQFDGDLSPARTSPSTLLCTPSRHRPTPTYPHTPHT